MAGDWNYVVVSIILIVALNMYANKKAKNIKRLEFKRRRLR